MYTFVKSAEEHHTHSTQTLTKLSGYAKTVIRNIICKHCGAIEKAKNIRKQYCESCLEEVRRVHSMLLARKHRAELKESKLKAKQSPFYPKHHKDHKKGDIRTCTCGERYIQIYTKQDRCHGCYYKVHGSKYIYEQRRRKTISTR